ncbi:reverse transcriptase domain-containing protein [Tanacetum coccineum]|uniref:Reverse transcriptase domain-containing protein n=1 Tax=Tanacetum coccineum TaxID=301880 RepID=A0ABQ4ZT89_9ASTR
MPFELMCDASDFAVGAVLGKRVDGKFKPIYYASKTLNNAQEHYNTTEKELLAVVFTFDKFRPYLILSKTVVYTDHYALKLENLHMEVLTEKEIADEFLDEHLMMLKAKFNNDEPLEVATVGKPASIEFKRIILTGFRSCTSRSRYWSVSKQTTRTSTLSNGVFLGRDGNKTRTRWGPDIRTRFDQGIPELTRDGDGDGESPILKTGMGAGMVIPLDTRILVPDEDGMGLKSLSPLGMGSGMGIDIEIGDRDGKHDPRNSPTHCHPYSWVDPSGSGWIMERIYLTLTAL